MILGLDCDRLPGAKGSGACPRYSRAAARGILSPAPLGEHPLDLRYEGIATHDGAVVHVLANTRALPLAGSGAAAEDASGKATKLRIPVLADGTPVFLSYHMTVTIDDGTGVKVAARGDIEQSFTDVGEPIVIAPPSGFTD